MTDPFLSDVTLIAKFGDQQSSLPPFLAPDTTVLPVIQAVMNSVRPGLKPGWHRATITFRLDEQGNPMQVEDYKVSSFGADTP
jgi:hypothetical protein